MSQADDHKAEIAALTQLYKRLNVWMAGLLGTCILGGLGAGMWMTDMRHEVSAATTELKKLVGRIEHTPTKAEINYMMQTLGKLNEGIEMPPELRDGN